MKKNSLKNVVIWGYHHKSDIQVIQELEKEGVINVVKWFGNTAILDNNLNALIHNPSLILKQDHIFPDAKYDDELRIYFEIFVESYSRIAFYRAKSTQELWHLFYMYVHHFYALINKTTDVILFQNLPHHGIDIILYAVAKVLKIRTILTTQSLEENRFWHIEDLKDFGIFKNIPEKEKLSLTIKKRFDKNLFYMQNIKTKKSLCIASLFTDLLKVKSRAKKKPVSLAGVFQKYKECKSYKACSKEAYIKEVDFSKKYVYFPLQLQPELTTSILGDKYVDQILALEQLSQVIPNDWVIYVKENPMQTARQRDELFYQRLKNIKKAHYISLHYNTHYLIEHSQFVAVVTGTAGWEAISGGKNVLVFGQAWYKSLVGVFSYTPHLSLSSITEYQINHKELEIQYSKLMSKTYKGIMDPDYIRMYPEYSDAKNVQYIKKFLLSVLSLGNKDV